VKSYRGQVDLHGNPFYKRYLIGFWVDIDGSLDCWSKDLSHLEFFKIYRSKEFRGNMKNTERYIHLEESYFKETSEEYVTKVAENIEEARPLIEAGFELAVEYGEAKVFRKRITQWDR